MSATPHNKNEMPIFDLLGRYAYALFELALEEGDLEGRTAEVEGLAGAINESQDLRALLEDQSQSIKTKQQALEQVGALVNFSPTLRRFIALVIEKSRSAELGAIAETFLKIAALHNNIVPIDVASAAPLNPSQEAKLQALCVEHFGDAALVQFSVDPTLLAGVKLNLPGRVIDASWAEKFAQLNENFKTHFSTP